MAKILVIQPHKMLQQAIALSLFPRYQTRTTASIPGSDEVKDVDAVIIDAASLREAHGLPAQSIRSLREWKLPMIWIESGDSSLAGTWDKMIVVKKPIGKEMLQKAVAECLGEGRKTAGINTVHVQNQEDGRSNAVITRNEEIAGAEIIELVDVVEEAPRRHRAKPLTS